MISHVKFPWSFLGWLVMFSIFHTLFWPCVCFLWRNIYSSLCLFLIVFFVIELSSLYILNTNLFSGIWLEKIFSESMVISSSHCFFPSLSRNFLVKYNPICLVLLWLPVLFGSYPKQIKQNHWPAQSYGTFPCFLIVVLKTSFCSYVKVFNLL